MLYFRRNCMFNIHSFEASSEKYANFSQLFSFAFRKWNENQEEKVFVLRNLFNDTNLHSGFHCFKLDIYFVLWGGKKDKDKES